MKKTLPVLVVVLLVTAFFGYVSQAQLPQKGSKNTITLPNGDVIWDLNGEWNAFYEHYGTMEWVGNSKGMIMMVQQGSTFVGKTTMDSAWSAKGTEKIRGELDKDGIRKAQYSIPSTGWTDAKGEMSKDCDKIVFDTGIGVKVTLERK